MPIAHAEKLLFSALGLTELPKVTKFFPEKEFKEEKKIEIKEEEIKEIVDDKIEEIVEKKKIV